MRALGFIEVFKNKDGYYTGRIVNNNLLKDGETVLAKAFIDVNFSKEINAELLPQDGETVSLNVKEGYILAKYINSEKPFSKLSVTIKDAELVGVYPQRKQEDVAPVKKVRKTSK